MAKDYFHDPHALRIPPIFSPFYRRLRENGAFGDHPGYSMDMARHGYTVIKSELPDEVIDGAVEDIQKLIKDRVYKNQDGYNYNDAPRVFEAWRHSDNVRKIATNPRVMKLIEDVYVLKPFPFQTINFTKGTSQPIHDDQVHFATLPMGYVVAAWTALEDINPRSGPLIYVPESHKERSYSYYDIGLPAMEKDDPRWFDVYHEYEEFVRKLMEARKMEPIPFIARKGEVFIWVSNLLHGGEEIRDHTLTRKSQVTHYYLSNCDKYYVPMMSEPHLGKYQEKDLSKKDFFNPANYLHSGE